MSQGNFTKWHIAGLHALRSASEQGKEGSEQLLAKVTDTEVQELLQAYSKAAADFQVKFVGFLKEFGEEPNSFKDQIMEGVGNGTSEMVKAAPDQQLLNLSALSGAVTGLDYYVGAFKDQGALAGQLGHKAQAASLQIMGQAASDLRKRFTQSADRLRHKAKEEA